MEEKIYKPKSCDICPCFDAKGKRCKCQLQPKSKSDTKFDIHKLWKSCPIGWDEPE